MKKLFFLIAATMFATNLSAATVHRDNPENEFSVSASGSVVKVLYKSESNCKVRVSILDSKNEIVFKETLRNRNGFLRPYNFSKLPPGEYVVSLEDGNNAYKESVKYSAEKSPVTFNISKVVGTEDKFVLSVPKSVGSFSVKIKSQSGNVLFEEEKTIDRDFAQVYNIAQLKAEVQVEVTDATGYTEKFTF